MTTFVAATLEVAAITGMLEQFSAILASEWSASSAFNVIGPSAGSHFKMKAAARARAICACKEKKYK